MLGNKRLRIENTSTGRAEEIPLQYGKTLIQNGIISKLSDSSFVAQMDDMVVTKHLDDVVIKLKSSNIANTQGVIINSHSETTYTNKGDKPAIYEKHLALFKTTVKKEQAVTLKNLDSILIDDYKLTIVDKPYA